MIKTALPPFRVLPAFPIASLLSGLTVYNGLLATAHLVENDVGSRFPFKRLGFVVPVSEPLVDGTFQFIYTMESATPNHAVRD